MSTFVDHDTRRALVRQAASRLKPTGFSAQELQTLESLSDADVRQAAERDPDCPPLSDHDLALAYIIRTMEGLIARVDAISASVDALTDEPSVDRERALRTTKLVYSTRNALRDDLDVLTETGDLQKAPKALAKLP